MATFKVLSTQDELTWHRYLEVISKKELVHFPHYMNVFERYGDGTGECFVYDDGGIVIYPFLRRSIPNAEQLTDIITPYGYGGMVYECDPGQGCARLIKNFRMSFADYARETNTVSEFVRFHPLLANHEHCAGLMDDVTLHCENIFLDLRVGKSALFQGYRRRYKTYLRKAENAGLTIEFADHDWPLDTFFDLYRKNMEAKGQTGYFNFRRPFLDELAEGIPDNLLSSIVRRGPDVLSAALFLRSGRFLDYFLAASDESHRELRPNHFLIHKTADWAIDNGFEFLQLGGGHESLQFFKRGFGNEQRPYYTGKHVFDSDSYKSLSAAHWRHNNRQWTADNTYFPAYRAEFSANQ